MQNLYYSLVYPYLIYCNIVWGGTYNTYLNQLAVLQKRVIRIITGEEYRAHTSLLFYRTKILKINDLNKYFLGLHMYKLKMQDNLPTVTHGYCTRQRDQIAPTFQRLTLTQHSVNYLGPHFWNSLPGDIKNHPNLTSFKSALKNYLIKSYVYQ